MYKPEEPDPFYGEGFVFPSGFTVNDCEITAFIKGLRWISENLDPSLYDYIHVVGDSNLIISYGTGAFTPKKAYFYHTMLEARALSKSLRRRLFFSHVAREDNTLPDRMGRLAVSLGRMVLLPDLDREVDTLPAFASLL